MLSHKNYYHFITVRNDFASATILNTSHGRVRQSDFRFTTADFDKKPVAFFMLKNRKELSVKWQFFG